MAEALIKTESIENTYEVKEELGRGRFAVVKRCIRKSTGEEFAAKFIRKARAGRRGREQLVLEIDILHNSTHQKLVRLYDVFETRSEMILILEYAEGGDLHKHCLEMVDTVRTEKEICHLIRQIVEAVRYLHEKRVVHLDLKPENILLKSNEQKFPEIKLIDFGLSRRLDVPYSQFDIVGTPEYVAPEVLSYEPLEVSADMWSIGVVTYVLLSGISPFAGDDVMETYGNIAQIDYDFDAEEFDDLSEDAKDFIDSLLLKDPKARMSARESLEHPWLKQMEDGVTAEDIAAAIKADTINPNDLKSKTLDLNSLEEEDSDEDEDEESESESPSEEEHSDSGAEENGDDHQQENSEETKEGDTELIAEAGSEHGEDLNLPASSSDHDEMKSQQDKEEVKVDKQEIKVNKQEREESIGEGTKKTSELGDLEGKDFTAESVKELASNKDEGSTNELVEASTNSPPTVSSDEDKGFTMEINEVKKNENISTDDEKSDKDVPLNPGSNDVSAVADSIVSSNTSSRKSSVETRSSREDTRLSRESSRDSKTSRQSSTEDEIQGVKADRLQKVKSKAPRSISLELRNEKRSGSFAKVKERFESGGIERNRFGSADAALWRSNSQEGSPVVGRKFESAKKVKSHESLLTDEDSKCDANLPSSVSDKNSRTTLQLKLENESPKTAPIVIRAGNWNKSKDEEKIVLHGQPVTSRFVANSGNLTPSTPSSAGSRTPDSGRGTPTSGSRTPSSDGRPPTMPSADGSSGRSTPGTPDDRPSVKKPIGVRQGIAAQMASKFANLQSENKTSTPVKKTPISPSPSRVSDRIKDHVSKVKNTKEAEKKPQVIHKIDKRSPFLVDHSERKNSDDEAKKQSDRNIQKGIQYEKNNESEAKTVVVERRKTSRGAFKEKKKDNVKRRSAGLDISRQMEKKEKNSSVVVKTGKMNVISIPAGDAMKPEEDEENASTDIVNGRVRSASSFTLPRGAKMQDLRGRSRTIKEKGEGSPSSPKKNYRRLYVTHVKGSKSIDLDGEQVDEVAQLKTSMDRDEALQVELVLKCGELKFGTL